MQGRPHEGVRIVFVRRKKHLRCDGQDGDHEQICDRTRRKGVLCKPRSAKVASTASRNTKAPSWVKASRSHVTNTVRPQEWSISRNG